MLSGLVFVLQVVLVGMLMYLAGLEWARVQAKKREEERG